MKRTQTAYSAGDGCGLMTAKLTMSTHKFGFIMLWNRFTGRVRKGALFQKKYSINRSYRAYLAGRVVPESEQKELVYLRRRRRHDWMVWEKTACYRGGGGVQLGGGGRGNSLVRELL